MSNRVSIEALVAKAKKAADEREESGVDEEPKDLDHLHASRAMDNHLDALFSKKHRKMTFDAFNPKTDAQLNAFTQAKVFANAIKVGGSPEGFGLFSPPGRGKTHLAVAILQDIVDPAINI
jgi:DNA replication protein DnaC